MFARPWLPSAAPGEPANVWTNLQAMLIRISAAEVEAVCQHLESCSGRFSRAVEGEKHSCKVAHGGAGLEPH